MTDDVTTKDPAPTRRHVSQPFHFDVVIQLGADGALEGLGQVDRVTTLTPVQFRMIQRASIYIGGLVEAAQIAGGHAGQIYANLPDGCEFAVERAVLREVLALQRIRGLGVPLDGLAGMTTEGRA